MTHQHDFEIVLQEILKDGRYRTTKQCDCNELITEDSMSGDWGRL